MKKENMMIFVDGYLENGEELFPLNGWNNILYSA